MYGFKPRHARGKPVQNYADGGLVNPLAGVGEYWSNSNAEFEAQNPNLLQRGVRAINPVTGFGSAVGAMHDGASVGSARDMAIAALQAVPVFGAMRAVAPAVKTVAGAAPAVLVPSMAKTAAKGAKGAAAGVAADEAQKNFADGGIVHSIKGALGFRPRTPEELLAADAKSQARNQEAAAAVAERNRKAQPAQQQQSAVSDYSGMLAMQRREKEQGLADGGTVKPRGFVAGKGTGTSDSIPARLSNGEYVLPADTVKAVGVEALDSLRAATHTPVKHEQAKAAHGFFAGGTPGGLDEEKRKNSFGDAAAVARDSSVAQVGGLANNGGADASRFAQVPAPIGTQPNRTPEPAAPKPAAPAAEPQAAAPAQSGAGFMPGTRSVYNESGKAISDLASQGRYGAAAGETARAALSYVPAVADDVIGGALRAVGPGVMDAGRQFFGGSQPGTAAPPTPPTPPTSPAAPVDQNPTDQRMAAGAQQAPAAATAPTTTATAPTTQPASAMVAPGAYRNAPGQYSDNASGMGSTSVPGSGGQGSPVGKTVEQAQREGLVGERVGYNPAYDQRLNGATGISAQNMAAADALAARQSPAGFQPAGSQQAGVQAPVVRNSTNDWAARNNLRNASVSASSITNNGGKFDRSGPGDSAAMAEYKAALATDQALQQAQPGMDQTAMRENAGIQREGMQQEGATTRTGIQEQGSNARAAVSSALQRDEFGLKKEAAGFQTRAAKRLEDLQAGYQNAKTPEERAGIAQQLRELQGKDAPARYKVAAGGQQIDANGVAYRTPDRIFNEQTGVYSDGAGAAPAPQAMPKPASKAEFDALPKGARFTDPNGQVRIK